MGMLNQFTRTLRHTTDTDSAPQLGEERTAADEARIEQAMIAAIKAITGKAHPAGVIRRFNQAKSIACLKADFEVPDTLPPELQHGLFAQPGHYPARIRFANATQDDDRKKDFRGMSIKISGLEGESLWGAAGTQDLLLNSHPALFAGTPAKFLDFIEATRKGEPWKFFVEPRNWDSLRIVLKGRDRIASPLDIPYWSTTPYRLGTDRTVAVKYAAKPCFTFTREIPDDAGPDFLSQAVRRHLEQGEACFDFMLQFQTDPVAMPIEDASVEWDEGESPFQKVARITIEAQAFLDDTARQECEQMTFNPWQCLPAHQPIGGINRVRKAVYGELGEFRTGQSRTG